MASSSEMVLSVQSLAARKCSPPWLLMFVVRQGLLPKMTIVLGDFRRELGASGLLRAGAMAAEAKVSLRRCPFDRRKKKNVSLWYRVGVGLGFRL